MGLVGVCDWKYNIGKNPFGTFQEYILAVFTYFIRKLEKKYPRDVEMQLLVKKVNHFCENLDFHGNEVKFVMSHTDLEPKNILVDFEKKKIYCGFGLGVGWVKTRR